MARPDFSDVEEQARQRLDQAFQARERALADCRRIIRASANAIRALHRGQQERADELMAEAGRLLEKTQEVLSEHPSILHAGFVSDAAKEYAEARLTAALSDSAAIPSPADISVGVVPYLHGLGETVGELRRRLLDLLRAGELERAEQTLETMDEIVDLLANLDYPDGMTAGLRRTTDVARSLVERSRSDLTATMVQERLREDLRRG